MHHQSFHWSKAGAAALTLGVWAGGCSSSETPESDTSAAGAPATNAVGTDGVATTGGMTGGTATGTTGETVAAGPSTAASATGAALTGTTGGTGTTGVQNTSGGTGGTGSVSVSATGSADAATTTGAATTGSNPEAACATRPTLAAPGITDFESYDGATVALEWDFVFNDDGSGMNLLYGGFFDNSDGSGTPSLDMVGGDTSTWAVRATNTQASEWGGGIGLWLGCMNASSYTGISLAARGATPSGNSISIAITVDGLRAGVGTTITVTDLFTTFQLPFADFTNEYGETTNGDNINGLAINAQMLWVQDAATEEWSVTPGAYELVVDDITFY